MFQRFVSHWFFFALSGFLDGGSVFQNNWEGKCICIYFNRDMASVKSQENEQTVKTDADSALFIL